MKSIGVFSQNRGQCQDWVYRNNAAEVAGGRRGHRVHSPSRGSAPAGGSGPRAHQVHRVTDVDNTENGLLSGPQGQ